LPVARTWQAHTSPNPPFPSTLYILNVFFVTGWLKQMQKLTLNCRCQKPLFIKGHSFLELQIRTLTASSNQLTSLVVENSSVNREIFAALKLGGFTLQVNFAFAIKT
jgi:hypothetical protein